MAKSLKDQLMSEKKTTKFCNILESLGYFYDRKSGSHMIYIGEGLPTLSIPEKREIAPGTRRDIVKLVLGSSYYN